MSRSHINYILAISLATLAGCSRAEHFIETPKPDPKAQAQPVKVERDRVTQMAFKALREYHKTNDQIEALNAYLTGCKKVILQKEKKDYAERKELSLIYSNTDFEKQSGFSLTERQDHLNREIAISEILLKELYYVIRELEKLQNPQLEKHVTRLFESAPNETYHLDALSEIHFQILTHLKTLVGKSNTFEEKLTARFTHLETLTKEINRNIRELEAAIEIETTSIIARQKLLKEDKIPIAMCGHTILSYAPKEINKLRGQIIGAERATIEIEFAQGAIRDLKNSLNLQTN